LPARQRLCVGVPHGHYKTVTLVAGIRRDGLVAAKAYDRPINAALFEEWVENCLVPTLSKGDIVVMDMYGRPRRCKKNLRSCAAHGQVLTCIRPLMRRSHMPRARMGVRGSDPLQSRALVALVHELVFPIPSRRPLRHTLRLTFLRRRQPSRSRPMRPRSEFDIPHHWRAEPMRRAPSCWPMPPAPAWAAYGATFDRAMTRPTLPCEQSRLQLSLPR